MNRTLIAPALVVVAACGEMTSPSNKAANDYPAAAPLFSVTSSSSLEGQWVGTYAWNCSDLGDGSRRGATPITFTIVQSAGSAVLSGHASYRGATVPIRGFRWSDPALNQSGSVIGGRIDPVGTTIDIETTPPAGFVYNEFTGTFDGARIVGTTLNGDSPGGCSANGGPSGTFSIVRANQGTYRYTYTGNTFDVFCSRSINDQQCQASPLGTSYSTSDFVSAVITLDAPLPPNLLLQDLNGLAGFHLVMSDGHQALTSAPGAIVSTDAAGQMVRPWFVRTNGPVPPNNGIATVNWPDVRGVGDVGAVSAPTGSTPSTPFDVAWKFASPGTWTFTVISANLPPVAHAGPDQTVDGDSRNGVNVMLDGSGSQDPDGTIQKYEWFEGDAPVGNGVAPTVMLSLGVHNVRLVVTDDDGATDDDVAVITVLGAAEQIAEVTESLETIAAENVGTPLGDRAQEALSRVQAAQELLAQQPPDRQGALAGLKDAVAELEAAVKERLLGQSEGAALMRKLATAARLLAQEAIADAEARGGDPEKIAKANHVLAEGDAGRDGGQYKAATAAYKQAVAKAEQA